MNDNTFQVGQRVTIVEPDGDPDRSVPFLVESINGQLVAIRRDLLDESDKPWGLTVPADKLRAWTKDDSIAYLAWAESEHARALRHAEYQRQHVSRAYIALSRSR